MTIIINDNNKCPECGAYWNGNGHCSNGHPIPEDWTVIDITCGECGKDIPLAYRMRDFISWYNKEKLIQDALPYLTPAEREMFITEICGECWDKLYKPSPCRTCETELEGDCLQCKHNIGNKED